MRAPTVVVAIALGVQAEPKMCPSPSGFHPCDCIREVESGTRAEERSDANDVRTLRLTHPNGTVEDVAECPYAPPPRGGGSAAAPRDPCALDWPHAAPMEVFSRHNESIVRFTASYVVPEPPSVTKANILYYWIGLQDTDSAANPVIQPVLSYYPGSSFPNNWYFESWNCCPAGHKIKSASVPVRGPGARLHGAMARAGGESVVNSTNEAGATSSLRVADGNIVGAWNWVDITLETYDVEACDEYSEGGAMVFDDMTLTNARGDAVTPAFVSKPYIDGAYLTPKESAAFTACCAGKFETAWPRATMTQN